MKESSKPKYTPAEFHELNTSRAQTDATAVEGGAVYFNNGELNYTTEQQNNARQEMGFGKARKAIADFAPSDEKDFRYIVFQQFTYVQNYGSAAGIELAGFNFFCFDPTKLNVPELQILMKTVISNLISNDKYRTEYTSIHEKAGNLRFVIDQRMGHPNNSEAVDREFAKELVAILDQKKSEIGAKKAGKSI